MVYLTVTEPTESKEGQCCMCYETKTYSLKEIIEDKDNDSSVIIQAKLILELGGNENDYYCEECFWK